MLGAFRHAAAGRTPVARLMASRLGVNKHAPLLCVSGASPVRSPHASRQWNGAAGLLAVRYMTVQTGPEDSVEANEPPLAVRAALVGGTTALLTPLFPVIGFNQLVFRFCDPATRAAINGGTSMLYFSAMVLVPKAFYYAPILLPCAIGNGLTAGALYLGAELAAGGPRRLAESKLGPVPLVGPALGVATAMLVPFTYPASWAAVFPCEETAGWVFDAEVYNFLWNLCYNQYVLPCLAVTGVASGFIIHLCLEPLIVGIPGVPWQRLAGGVLAGIALGLVALYSTSMRNGVLHLKDVDLEDPKYQGWFFPERAPCYIKGERELFWVPGLDHSSGEVVSAQILPDKDADGNWLFSHGEQQESGCTRAAVALDLAEKAKDQRARVYTSQRGAFFDGPLDPLDQKALAQMLAGFPVGEAIITDALVVLVAGSAPRAKVEESLRELLPLLSSSALATRLNMRVLDRAWASGSVDLLKDLSLRAAQFRELVRLKKGAAPGPVTTDSLQQALSDAGVDVERAMGSLDTMGWTPGNDKRCRSADWALIKELDWRWRKDAATLALKVACLGSIIPVAYKLLQTDG